MARIKLSAVNTVSVVIGADVLYVVTDVAGDPLSNAITVDDLFTERDFLSLGAIPADTGALRLTNNEWINARNAADDADINLVKLNANDELALRGAMRLAASEIILPDAVNIELNPNTGTQLGTATTEKLGFWGATPVAQQVLATGTGKTVDNVITLLQTLGLCKQS